MWCNFTHTPTPIAWKTCYKMYLVFPKADPTRFDPQETESCLKTFTFSGKNGDSVFQTSKRAKYIECTWERTLYMALLAPRGTILYPRSVSKALRRAYCSPSGGRDSLVLRKPLNLVLDDMHQSFINPPLLKSLVIYADNKGESNMARGASTE